MTLVSIPDQPELRIVFGDRFIDIISRAYSEPWRKYHTIQHLGEMLDAWRMVEASSVAASELSGGTTVLEAIIFHDFVYVPGHPKNEEMSAHAHHKSMLNPGTGSGRVTELIMATKHHWIQFEPNDPERDYFLDCDLIGFGTSTPRYDQISQQIAEELGHLPNYKCNRKWFLRHILEREHVFLTELFQEQFEDKARENIAREVFRLL